MLQRKEVINCYKRDTMLLNGSSKVSNRQKKKETNRYSKIESE